jgi:hypothetical protein
MVERKLPKLHTRVRFPSPAPSLRATVRLLSFPDRNEIERVDRRDPLGLRVF